MTLLDSHTTLHYHTKLLSVGVNFNTYYFMGWEVMLEPLETLTQLLLAEHT